MGSNNNTLINESFFRELADRSGSDSSLGMGLFEGLQFSLSFSVAVKCCWFS